MKRIVTMLSALLTAVTLMAQTGSFVPVATFNNSTTNVEFVTCDFSNYNGNGNRIAFNDRWDFVTTGHKDVYNYVNALHSFNATFMFNLFRK